MKAGISPPEVPCRFIGTQTECVYEKLDSEQYKSNAKLRDRTIRRINGVNIRYKDKEKIDQRKIQTNKNELKIHVAHRNSMTFVCQHKTWCSNKTCSNVQKCNANL